VRTVVERDGLRVGWLDADRLWQALAKAVA
jgi:hypothetical protein